jgi:Sensors of blue-light using FAD
MLVRLLYASRATEPLTTEVVETIMEQSRWYNIPYGITGMLCFSDSVFIQVLEGGRDQVCELYHKVARDSRHNNVRLLHFEEIPERRFASWTMGQVNLAKVNPALLLKYSEQAALDPFSSSGLATMALLDELIATGSVVSRST